MRPWRKICCPVDFSDTSRTALQQAAYLASVFDGSVTAVHVYDPPLETGDAPSPVFDVFEKARPELAEPSPHPSQNAIPVMPTGSA